MFGPANGESNNLALERIYGVLIVQIRMRFCHLNYGEIKQLSHKGRGGHVHPRTTPLLRPCELA